MIDVSHLSELEKTLFIPLAARARAHKLCPVIFNDVIADEIIKRVKYDFQTIIRQLGDNFLFPLARSMCFDQTVYNFIQNNVGKNPVIVDLGAGLDTGYHRCYEFVNKTFWINVDSHDVMELRTKVLPFEKDRHLLNIHWDIFSENFPVYSVLIKFENAPILFLAGGLLQYHDKEKVLKLIGNLADWCPGSEMIFDSVPGNLVDYANNALTKLGFNTHFKFGLEDEKVFTSIHNVELVNTIYPLEVLLQNPGLPLRYKSKLAKANEINRSKMIHLKFKGDLY
jgi:O-methyltransferase involved in polyketide biosynthesis